MNAHAHTSEAESTPMGGTCPVMDHPAPREHPLHPPQALTDLHGGPDLSRIRLWDGSTVWLVTDHAHARALLGDARLTAVTSSPGFPMMTPTSTLVRDQPRSASFIRMDQPEHGQLRSMLSREFLPRAIERHRAGVRETLDQTLESAIRDSDGTLDLVDAVAAPVPARVIASVLAIPAEDLDFFVGRSAVLIDRSYTPAEVTAAREDLDRYLGGLAATRLAEPGDDLISRLMSQYVATGALAVEDAVPMIRLLLVAGHGTTASQASLSLLSVLTDPALRERCVTDPDAIPAVVDELLRFHSIVQNGLARAATEDIEVGDMVIRAGEGLVISLSAANRDPSAFPDPNSVDPDRDSRRHVAFGHGIHQCLGQWLAKLELEEIISAVLSWMPEVRLAVPFEDLRFRPEVSSYGVDQLPVTW